jgi:hypothetical protein
MDGKWITTRVLLENENPTNQIAEEVIILETNGCEVEGSFESGGKIFEAGFIAGELGATNLYGQWSLGGETGDFNIDLLSGDKDCASFEGSMRTWDDKKWKWTGHKEGASTISCEAECRGRDPHQIWNGEDEYPYCNCVCESGWEFDASGKKCVPAGTSDINPCVEECKKRNAIWDNIKGPYCNCLCDKGFEFDANGQNCVLVKKTNDNAPDNTPSGTTPTSGQTRSAQLQVTTSQGTKDVEPGAINFFLSPTNSELILKKRVKCKELEMNILLLKLKLQELKAATSFESANYQANAQAIGEMNLLRSSIELSQQDYDKICEQQKATIEERDPPQDNGPFYDIALPSDSAGSPPLQIKVNLQQGPIEVLVDDLVSLDVVTPSVVVSSQGKNAFGVAYDPESGKSFVAAYQYPIQVQPAGGQAPFTLESGQQIEISNSQVRQTTPSGQMSGEETAENQGSLAEGSEGGCYTDPFTGEINCIGSSGASKGSQKGTQDDGSQGLCYEDPETGETVCTGSSIESSNNQGGSLNGCYQDPYTGEYICIDSYEPQQCSWTGTWSTTWGEMNLQRSANGGVAGNYAWEGGEIEGTANGNELSGRWAEPGGGTGPHDKGNFIFTMSEDCKSFGSKWNYDDNPDWRTDWTGTR